MHAYCGSAGVETNQARGGAASGDVALVKRGRSGARRGELISQGIPMERVWGGGERGGTRHVFPSNPHGIPSSVPR